MIQPEDELGVLLHVSVSDVQPQVDHASRALAARRRHAVTWTAASAGFVVGGLVVTFVALGAASHGARTPEQVLAGERWQHDVHLDGNRLLIEPPQPGDRVALTREETVGLLQSTESGTPLSVLAARWGRVSVRDGQGQPIPGFDKELAWTVVFRVHDEATCPTTQIPQDPTVAPGDYSGVQVFVVAGSSARLVYSQAGSWSCGLPAQSLAQLPEDAG